MSFGVFNIDMTFQIRSKILFKKSFGDALSRAGVVGHLTSTMPLYCFSKPGPKIITIVGPRRHCNIFRIK